MAGPLRSIVVPQPGDARSRVGATELPEHG